MTNKNGADQPPSNTHVFMLRMWQEDLGGGQTDWRGKVQHVESGEARYFRDWATLQAFVEGLLGSQGLATNTPKGVNQEGRAENGP
jgi:hypothetical protein